MHWDVKTVLPLDNFELAVELVDGSRGVFDLKPYLHLPAFRALNAPERFAQVAVLHGALTWPDGQDIAPDTLLAELKLTQLP